MSNMPNDLPAFNSGVKISTHPGKPAGSRLEMPGMSKKLVMQKVVPPVRCLPNPRARKSNVRDLRKPSPEDFLDEEDLGSQDARISDGTSIMSIEHLDFPTCKMRRDTGLSHISLDTLESGPDIIADGQGRENQIPMFNTHFFRPGGKETSVAAHHKTLQVPGKHYCPPAYHKSRPSMPHSQFTSQLFEACVQTSSVFDSLEAAKASSQKTPPQPVRNFDAEVQGRSRMVGGKNIIQATVPVTGSALDYIPTPIRTPAKKSAISRKKQPRLNTGFEEEAPAPRQEHQPKEPDAAKAEDVAAEKQRVSLQILDLLPKDVDPKDLKSINTLEYGFAIIDEGNIWIKPPPLDIEMIPSYDDRKKSRAEEAKDFLEKYFQALRQLPFSASTACLIRPSASNPEEFKNTIYQRSSELQEIRIRTSERQPRTSFERSRSPERRSSDPPGSRRSSRRHASPDVASPPPSTHRISATQESAPQAVVSEPRTSHPPQVSIIASEDVEETRQLLAYEGFDRCLSDCVVSWAQWTTSQLPKLVTDTKLSTIERNAISKAFLTSPSLYCSTKDRSVIRRLSQAIFDHREVCEIGLLRAAGKDQAKLKEVQIILRSIRGIWKLCLWEWDQRPGRLDAERTNMNELHNDITQFETNSCTRENRIGKVPAPNRQQNETLTQIEDCARHQLRAIHKKTLEMAKAVKAESYKLLSDAFNAKVQKAEESFKQVDEKGPTHALRILYASKSPNSRQLSRYRRHTNSSLPEDEASVSRLGTPAGSVTNTPRPVRPRVES